MFSGPVLPAWRPPPTPPPYEKGHRNVGGCLISVRSWGARLRPLTPASSRKALKVLIHPGSEPTDLRLCQRWAPVVLSANLSTLRSALSQGGGYSPPQTGMLASLPGPGRRVVVPQTSIPCMVQASES